MKINVLKLGHRPHRDKRVATHLALTARAFGASKITYTGIKNQLLENSVNKVVSDWGGSFAIEHAESWRSQIQRFKMTGKVVHLTMYGSPLQEMISSIRKDTDNMLVVVGGEKVPGEVYKMADWNVSITSQPHSEVGALAVFLHELHEGKELNFVFEGAKLKLVPQKKGKKYET